VAVVAADLAAVAGVVVRAVAAVRAAAQAAVVVEAAGTVAVAAGMVAVGDATVGAKGAISSRTSSRSTVSPRS
jgi:hypothetical protein